MKKENKKRISKKQQAVQRMQAKEKRSDRQKACFMIILRNMFILYAAFIGHKMNFGNHHFWESYNCNSADHKAHGFALKMHVLQLVTHLLFYRYMRFQGASMILFLCYALTWPLPVIVPYDDGAFTHMFFSVLTATAFFVHISYELFKQKQWHFVSSLFVCSYFVAMVTMGLSMDWSPYLNFERGVRSEWFMIISGMIFQTLLAWQS